MRRFATWITGHRKTVIFSWIAALVIVGFTAKSVGADYNEEFNLPQSDSVEALELLEDTFPEQAGEEAKIVYTAQDGVESGAVKSKMEGLFKKVEGVKHVSEVANPYASTKGGAAGISKDGTIAYASIQFDQRNDEIDTARTEEIIDDAQAVNGGGLQVELGGQPIGEAEEEEGDSSAFIGILAAIVILLIAFGSVVAMGLPIITALFALGVGLSLVTISTYVFSTASFAPFLAIMIGLGVGIDYALFILTRFRNNLDEGQEPRQAAIEAVDTAGRAVLFAGITVIIALLGMFTLGIDFLYGVATAAGLAVLMTMIAALTMLPALLTLVGHRIDRLRLPGMRKKTSTVDEDTRWFRWSREIQRRPVLSALVSGAVLLALCIPTLSLRLGVNDEGTEPTGKTTRKAYDLLAEGFGAGFNGPLLVAAALPEPGDTAGLDKMCAKVGEDPGVETVTTPIFNKKKTTGICQAYPTTSPQSEGTTELVDRIRGDVVPEVEAETGATVHIGGITAAFEDFGNAITAKLPLFIGIVVALSALLLMAVFRSILVPLKAVAMNLLSIGAAFGIVVAIFQWGWGDSIIGIDNTGPIIAFFPIFLFAIIFGLSMDYEVFLMSRMHEEWEDTKDATEAVTRGLALTGRVITAAAAIMVMVFLSFVLQEERITKLFGIGLASAVFVDAVVIRSVLVPALMQLFGARAWWLPDWLGRILPNLAVESSGQRQGQAQAAAEPE